MRRVTIELSEADAKAARKLLKDIDGTRLSNRTEARRVRVIKALGEAQPVEAAPEPAKPQRWRPSF